MLNQPLSPLGCEADSARDWDVDQNPQFRLVVLWVMMAIPFVAIVIRMAQLQLVLRDELSAAFGQKTETFEDIPARDGRILAADGTVLAGDVETYDLAVYFPAIKNPPDEAWITEKAKPRLSKADRKDKAKLEAEKQKVLAESEILWQRLADLAGRPLNDLMDARNREQARVERIKSDVQRRYQERHASSASTESRSDAESSLSWQRFWSSVQSALSEPSEAPRGPQRIREEEDYHTILTRIDDEMKREIEGHPERYPFTRVLVHSQRTYPQGELASHLVGFRKPLSDEQLKERRLRYPEGDPQDYRAGDPAGLSGLEQQYDARLKGVRGKLAVVKNRKGEIVQTRVVREPQHGRDLELTLDLEIQRKSEQILDTALTRVTRAGSVDLESTQGKSRELTCPQGGSIVAMDVHTGAILAAAAAPRFDLNMMVSTDVAQWQEVMSDPRGPFLSRATHMALPPGSVFKVISAVATVESGKMHPAKPFYCQGYLDRPDRRHRCMPFIHQGVGHGDVTLADALCRSCNVYFYSAARDLGPQTLVDWSRKFGIGQPTGIDLPSESAGNLPVPDASTAPGERRSKWRPGDTLDLYIGQAQLTVTPLQMVRVMAAIANDGQLVTPRLAAESGPALLNESSSLRNSIPVAHSQRIEGLHEETLDAIREGLTMVVHHPRGTGYKTVRMKEVTIAGKTGTAQTNGVDHAWFAGYVPAEQPRIAFVVVLQNGGGGGAIAGPVAHDLVQTLVELGLVTKSSELASDHADRP